MILDLMERREAELAGDRMADARAFHKLHERLHLHAVGDAQPVEARQP